MLTHLVLKNLLRLNGKRTKNMALREIIDDSSGQQIEVCDEGKQLSRRQAGIDFMGFYFSPRQISIVNQPFRSLADQRAFEFWLTENPNKRKQLRRSIPTVFTRRTKPVPIEDLIAEAEVIEDFRDNCQYDFTRQNYVPGPGTGVVAEFSS